jgi:hypothetical protein
MAKQQDWKKVLKADPTNKLLEQLGHLDRYYILREIMEKPEDDAEVSSLRKELADEILSKQMEDGSWNGKAHDYENGTTQQLMKLVELGMSTRDEPVRKGTEYLFRCQSENGSFSKEGLQCGIEANLVTTNSVLLALTRTGYGDDPRVAKGYEWLCSWQDEDGSWLSPRARISREQGEGYPHPYCGLHATCNALLGLSATEQTRQSQSAQRGAEFILSVYGSKYDRSTEPPYVLTSIPFDGAWHDLNCVDPATTTDRSERVVEMITTEHVLSTLSMLGYGLENDKVGAGVERLLGFQARTGLWLRHNLFTLSAMFTIKSFYQPLRVFSYHGH